MTNKERFLDICRTHIHREGIETLLKWLVNSDFFTAPASTRFHGCYEGCLCEHSLNVYDTLRELRDKYAPEISDETIAIVALFHDVCKINFYKIEKKNVKEDGRWIEKDVYVIDEKVPLGHGEKSCILLQWYIHLTVEELLAIRWHMGEFDCAVKGGDYGLNNARDMSKLIPLLHIADLIASSVLESNEKQAL